MTKGNGKQAQKTTVGLPEKQPNKGQVIIPPARIGPLHTQKGTRSEIARVYRLCRRGEIPPEVATKLTYMLHTLSKVIESDTMEQRMSRMEARQDRIDLRRDNQ